MANIKISELTPKGANLASTDLLEISESAGGGTYVTKSITGAQILAAAGGVTSVSGTAPIASSGGSTPTISIATANTSTTGALTSTDWNTFNGKQAALVSGTNIKTINGNSILGSGDLVVGGSSYPVKLASSFSGIQITGQSVVISDALYIPANTITATNFLLNINATLYRTFSGAGGGVNGWLYLNSTNSLTGATLIGRSGQIGSGLQWAGFSRFFPIKTTTGYGIGTSNTLGFDQTTQTGFTFTFDKTQNNYIIFAISSVNVNDGGTWINSKADLYV
jgi:hypothetical protein